MAERLKDLAALLAGASFTLALAPFDVWPIALVTPGLLFTLVFSATQRQVLRRFYLFNVGLFAAGASWIYVSINVYGNASPLLAGFLVAAFVFSYSLVCLPQAYVFARYCRGSALTAACAFAGLWVLQEWFRSWFLTGFPWLFQGYGLSESPFVSVVPILGVFGLGLLAVVISVFSAAAVMHRNWRWLIPVVVLLPMALVSKDYWTSPGETVTVSLVQGNVDQHTKWRRENRNAIFNLYRSASATEWDQDLVIWPEASLTYFRENATRLLDYLDTEAGARGSALLLGIPDRNEDGAFQNTVMIVGDGEGQYIKRRLVPFGEYVPLESLLRGVIQLFDLPMSRNTSGPAEQAPLLAGSLKVAVSICYEVVYPELVRKTVDQPDLLVTVSNDTWFGESIGPWQHLQMARMRALENGRSMARGTNNGVTALINHLGELQASLPQFEPGVLRGELEIRSGATPYHRFGVYPTLIICLLLVIIPLVVARRRPL